MPNLTPNYSFYLPLVDDPTDQDLWGGYLNSNFTSLDTLLANLTPSGVVTSFAGSTAPSGWILCYGQAISRTTYAALFTAIGTTYGSGDGSTTFNIPDLRGRVVAGVDNMGGTTAGRISVGAAGFDGTILGNAGGNQALHGHTHTATVSDPGHAHSITSYGSLLPQAGETTPCWANTAGSSTGSATTGISVSNANAGGGSSQNVQPTMMLNYIIKT